MVTKLIRLIYRLCWKYLKRIDGISKENNQRKKDRTKLVNGLKVTEHAVIRYFERVDHAEQYLEYTERMYIAAILARKAME